MIEGHGPSPHEYSVRGSEPVAEGMMSSLCGLSRVTSGPSSKSNSSVESQPAVPTDYTKSDFMKEALCVPKVCDLE